MKNEHRRLLTGIGVIIFLLLYVFHNYLLWGNLTEDAFISLRYARNLAAGEGLVYNPGERVEGYTNFLWVVLEALLFTFSADAAHGIKVIGLMIGIITWLLLLIWSLRWFGKTSFLMLVPVAYLSISGYFIHYAITGLETNLYGLLLLLGLYFFTQGTVSTGSLYATVCLLAACLTRPEGLFFSAGMFAVQGYLVFAKRMEMRHLIRNTVVFAVPITAYLVWKLWYFGSVVPNTFYARTGTGLEDFMYTWWQGRVYTMAFIRTQHWFPLIILLSVFQYRKYPGIIVCLLFTVLFFAVVTLEGGDYMVFYRMYVPLLPVLFLLLAPATMTMLNAVTKYLAGPGRVIVVFLHIILWISLALYWVPVAAPLNPDQDSLTVKIGKWYRTNRMYDTYTEGEIEFGKWLSRHTPPGFTMATQFAGVVPYYSGLTTYDCLGLTDTHIGRSKLIKKSQTRKPAGKGKIKTAFAGPAHEKRDWLYIIKKDPGFMVLHSPPKQLLQQAGYMKYKFPGRNREYWAKKPVPWLAE